jgi:hypothetical protein
MNNYLFRFFVLVVSSIFFSVPFSAAQESPKNAVNTPTVAVDSPEEYGIIETNLPCEEVNQIAHRSIQRLGYKVDSFTPAAGDKAGLIKASRTFVWGDKEPVSVKIVCKAGGIDIDARPDVPPCEQANRIAHLAIEHLGYKVTEFTPAAVGKPGIVKGKKDKEPEVFITLFCEGRMVTMDTSADSPLLKNSEFYTAIIDFRRGFLATYKAQRSVIPPSPRAASEDQLQVVMHPLSKSDAKAALGSEITSMLTVQVEIANPTKRSYQLDPEKILLVSIGGERIKPILEKDNAFPVHALTNQSVAPGGQVKGYLYYPLGTYTGARGALVEEKSQEREGFEVPF